MQAVFYGVGAAVIGIIVMSSYKLTLKSIGKINLDSLKKTGFVVVLYNRNSNYSNYWNRKSDFVYSNGFDLYADKSTSRMD